MALEQTVLLSGDEQAVKITGINCDIRNDGVDTIYVSRRPGIVEDAAGVVSIPAGRHFQLRDVSGTVYVSGTGKATLCGHDHYTSVFDDAPAGGGSGTTDQAARDSINDHANNADIHLTADKICNPNLLINPRMDINQRGAEEYSALTKIGYCVDGWVCRGNSMVIPVDGGVKIACGEESTSVHSFITQTVENGYRLAGKTVTYSVNVTEMTVPRGMISLWAGDGVAEPTAVNFTAYTSTGKVVVTAEIPNTAKMVMTRIDGARAGAAVGDYSIISGAKLEIGGHATEFGIPDPAAELARCQRYYQVRSSGDINPVDLRPSMATITDVKERGDGNYEYIAEL